jgi:hypothetical protein
MRRVWPAIILMGALLLPGVASGAAVTEYALTHPKHERCRSHYLRWSERRQHRSSVRCIYQPPPYGGPWDSAHEPSPISNAGISLASGGTGTWALEVTASPHVWCLRGHPEPITWTFSDPSGWSSVHLEPYRGGCTPFWPGLPPEKGGKPGFRLLPEPLAAMVDLEWTESKEPREIPVCYEVSGRHGVIAQGALSYEEVSGNGLGGGRFRHGGWPAA